MKSLILFVLGVIVGGAAYHYLALNAPPVGDDPRTTAQRARAGAEALGEQVSDRLADWNLRGEDVRRELQEGGEVVREKAQIATARIDDARIVSLIKAKYVLDRHLKALSINVDARDGEVVLQGEVQSEEAIGRAVAIALETQGVVRVQSELTVATATE